MPGKKAGYFDRSPDSIQAPEIAAQLQVFATLTKANRRLRYSPKTILELRRRLLGSVFITANGKGDRATTRNTVARSCGWDALRSRSRSF